MQSGREDSLETRYAIKFCVKLGKNASETYDMLQTAYGPTCMSRASIFRWHWKFKDGIQEGRDDDRSGRSRDVRTPDLVEKIHTFMDEDRHVSIETIAMKFGVGMTTVHRIIHEDLNVRKVFAKFVSSVLFQSGLWHLHQDNVPVHNSILVTNYLTEMGVKTVPHPPYSPDLAPCDFWLFPKLKEHLRGNRFEDIESMKEAVTRALDTFTLNDFQGAFQK